MPGGVTAIVPTNNNNVLAPTDASNLRGNTRRTSTCYLNSMSKPCSKAVPWRILQVMVRKKPCPHRLATLSPEYYNAELSQSVPCHRLSQSFLFALLFS